ncbi:hypothetical protein CC78DRAFT_541863 [Lojkania enalia]|uniref:Actin-like ATPase domain-containing protein n=1 Tax=Lojkania enalia TaxID=147567 RepID=A0A9P4KFU7_9PLEO|nr:hypothetical protein CC78DRAFT_541863 [Didymosphaeria enalia]
MGFLDKLKARSKNKSRAYLREDTDTKPANAQYRPSFPKPPTRKPDVFYKDSYPAPSPGFEKSTFSPIAEAAAYIEDELEILLRDLILTRSRFSGAAWAYSKQPQDVKIVTSWDSEGFQNFDKGKAPSKIAYGSSDLTSQPDGKSSAHLTWGYGIREDETEFVEWFKLLLLDENDLNEQHPDSQQIRRAKRLLQRAGKTAVRAVADYLQLLWHHTLRNIEKDLGEIAVEGLPFHVVLTVPAVWTARAVSRMRQAAKQAGILEERLAGETTLHFVSEPEAAAIATFDDLKVRPNFHRGDTFVVCDAGGGTVDLISYKVLQADPLQLGECVEGSGKLCGAVFLDQDFEGLMKQLVGAAWNVPDAVIKRIVDEQWENGIKRGFEGQDRNWKITLPIECVQQGAPHSITLNKGHVREIFENVISKIRSLVNDQIDAVEEKERRLPKAVVLVGGFGSCRYLYNILNLEHRPRGIEIYQSSGTKPWTAICRGAVLKALTNSRLPGTTVQTRISRCSYGVAYNTQFGIGHLECDKYFSPFHGHFRANNQMQWFLKRGDNILEAQSVIVKDWSQHFLRDQHPYKFIYSSAIYSCDKQVPPSRMDNTVKYVGKMESERDVTSAKDVEGADSKLYKKYKYSIEMAVIGTAVEFSTVFGEGNAARTKIDIELEQSW